MLDYGDLKTPITLFSCEWKRRHDMRRRSSYVRDNDGFLVVNFKNNVSLDSYVFPVQCTQVFYAEDDLHAPGSDWRVVLRKEARSKRKMEEDDDVFISTNVEAAGMVPSFSLSEHPVEPDLTGVIILNDVDNAIALQGFEKERRRPLRQKATAANDVPVRKKKGGNTITETKIGNRLYSLKNLLCE